MTDSREAWLESLDPRVRADVEAEIAFYENSANYEIVDEPWESNPNPTFGLTVEFSRDEITTLSRAFGASVEMFGIMHDALMERARTILAERGDSKSDTVAAD